MIESFLKTVQSIKIFDLKKIMFIYSGRILTLPIFINQKIENVFQRGKIIIEVKDKGNFIGGGGRKIEMEINIQFIKRKDQYFPSKNEKLFGLSKLCLLKEISSKLEYCKIEKINSNISWILEILRNGYIIYETSEKGI